VKTDAGLNGLCIREINIYIRSTIYDIYIRSCAVFNVNESDTWRRCEYLWEM